MNDTISSVFLDTVTIKPFKPFSFLSEYTEKHYPARFVFERPISVCVLITHIHVIVNLTKTHSTPLLTLIAFQ